MCSKENILNLHDKQTNDLIKILIVIEFIHLKVIV